MLGEIFIKLKLKKLEIKNYTKKRLYIEGTERKKKN
jgi:hypothetical protein